MRLLAIAEGYGRRPRSRCVGDKSYRNGGHVVRAQARAPSDSKADRGRPSGLAANSFGKNPGGASSRNRAHRGRARCSTAQHRSGAWLFAPNVQGASIVRPTPKAQRPDESRSEAWWRAWFVATSSAPKKSLLQRPCCFAARPCAESILDAVMMCGPRPSTLFKSGV